MPPDQAVIGVIEDDPVMAGTLAHRLELEGYKPVLWQTGRDALEGLRGARPDLVVCDIRLPDMSGEDVFFEALPSLAGTPFLFVTGFGQIDQAVRLTKAGAVDYIAKPYVLSELIERLPSLLRARAAPAGVLGESEAMCEVETLLRRVANIDSSLLISGESGAGKEIAARFVHGVSARAEAPFMAVNCAAIPTQLIESEIFGHEKGAFTGAHARHLGYAERAGPGVLFLDEVGELPLAVQAKLLRLVQDRAFTRIGGETTVKFRARLVCATNAKLDAAVAEGRFRSDLFYRINVIPVTIPPLRDRSNDILPLAERFVAEFSTSFQVAVYGLSESARRALLVHHWPGNVRELRNRVERAVALADRPWVDEAALFPATPEDGRGRAEPKTLSEARDEAERRHIQAALRRVEGRVEEAAKSLGISRSTLFEKMKKLDVRSDA